MSARAFRITIDGGDASFGCPPGERVLIAMERQGLKHVPVGCRGGGCGVCRVRVIRGRYRTAKMSRAHVSAADEAAGFALACRLIPQTDLSLHPAAATHNARTRSWQ